MTTTVRKGLIGKEDVKFYTAASPTFTRVTSYGSATPMTAVSATHIPLVQSAGSRYFSQNTVQRAANETLSRYIAVEHSMATYGAGALVGHHRDVFGFRNALAATSIQAAASNMFLESGGYGARIVVPAGIYTVATPIQLPRKCVIFGMGPSTIFRQNQTTQTSRIFSITGAVGSTSQAFTAFSALATQITVTNGAQFAGGGWVRVENYPNVEIKQIRSVAGNNLNFTDYFYRRFSAGTVKTIYPAEIVMGNLSIELSSATQGIGVSATNITNSVVQNTVKISGAADAGVLVRNASGNRFEMTVERASSVAAGKGYGVRLLNAVDNSVGGYRKYTRTDAADNSSTNNIHFGVQHSYRGASNASGMSPAYLTLQAYRMTKPTLIHTTYSVGGTATRVVTTENNSAISVRIDNRYMTNIGRVLCDLSRTITPANATVCGLDRGPAQATRTYTLYAVPTQFPTATRQWDLIASSGNTAPTASSTFPLYTPVGKIFTGSTVRVLPFKHVGRSFTLTDQMPLVFANNGQAQATPRIIPNTIMSNLDSTSEVFLAMTAATTALRNSAAPFDFRIYDGSLASKGTYSYRAQTPQYGGAAANTYRMIFSDYNIRVPFDGNRVGIQNVNAATCAINLYFRGFNYNIDSGT